MISKGAKQYLEDDSLRFSYGHPSDPRETDPCFPTQDLTEQAVEGHNILCPWDNLLAVFDNETGEILKLYHDGVWYRPD